MATTKSSPVDSSTPPTPVADPVGPAPEAVTDEATAKAIAEAGLPLSNVPVVPTTSTRRTQERIGQNGSVERFDLDTGEVIDRWWPEDKA
jgi:hypothetical protein